MPRDRSGRDSHCSLCSYTSALGINDTFAHEVCWLSKQSTHVANIDSIEDRLERSYLLAAVKDGQESQVQLLLIHMLQRSLEQLHDSFIRGLPKCVLQVQVGHPYVQLFPVFPAYLQSSDHTSPIPPP